jgi:hypothetical protein
MGYKQGGLTYHAEVYKNIIFTRFHIDERIIWCDGEKLKGETNISILYFSRGSIKDLTSDTINMWQKLLMCLRLLHNATNRTVSIIYIYYIYIYVCVCVCVFYWLMNTMGMSHQKTVNFTNVAIFGYVGYLCSLCYCACLCNFGWIG